MESRFLWRRLGLLTHYGVAVIILWTCIKGSRSTYAGPSSSHDSMGRGLTIFWIKLLIFSIISPFSRYLFVKVSNLPNICQFAMLMSPSPLSTLKWKKTSWPSSVSIRWVITSLLVRIRMNVRNRSSTNQTRLLCVSPRWMCWPVPRLRKTSIFLSGHIFWAWLWTTSPGSLKPPTAASTNPIAPISIGLKYIGAAVVARMASHIAAPSTVSCNSGSEHGAG